MSKSERDRAKPSRALRKGQSPSIYRLLSKTKGMKTYFFDSSRFSIGEVNNGFDESKAAMVRTGRYQLTWLIHILAHRDQGT